MENILTENHSSLKYNTKQDILDWIDSITNIDQQIILYKIFNDYNSHKIYLIESIYNENNLEIKLLGGLNKKNTRDNYQIIINLQDKIFNCSCKDFLYRSNTKNSICKHISFLVFKVASLFFDNNFNINIFLETKKLTESQFNKFKYIIDSNKLWNSKYALQTINTQFKNNDRNFSQDKLCPICYNEFNNEPLLNCPKCNNSIHEECMNIWLQYKKTCVYCRNDIWEDYQKII